MKIYPTNPLDDITLTASTTATGYNVRSVQNISLAKKWRPVGVVSANVVAQMLQGYQELGLTGKTGTTQTGLSTSTQYYFKVAEDEENMTEYNITTGGAGNDTRFTEVMALLDNATSGISTWSLASGDLRNTSDTYGPDSTIRMLAGQATDLFATLTDFTAFEPSVYGSGISLPTVAILDGHNLTIDAVVKIQGHTSNSWGGPDVNITMTRGTNGIYYAITGFSEKEWWRYLIEDPSNTAGYMEVGRLWLGGEIIITGAERTTREVRPDTTVKSFSRSGQVYSDTGYRYRSYNVNFPYWNNTNKTDIETFINNARGAPFYVAFDEANIVLMPLLYAVLGEEIGYTNISALAVWNGTLNFREVK